MAIELADVPIHVVSPRGAVAHRAAPVSSATLVAAALAVAATLYLGFAVSGRQAALFLVGVAAGVVLYHAAFGFTSSWRHFVTSARGDGLRAQMLMLAVTCAILSWIRKTLIVFISERLMGRFISPPTAASIGRCYITLIGQNSS